jgi:hypothetical protein
MKRVKILIFILIVFLISGCMRTRYITERYIKTKIENHTSNQFSSIRTYSIYKSEPGAPTYLELTGYKYKGNKALVIGADRYFNARKIFPGDLTKKVDIYYLELTIDEVNMIIANHEALLKKIKSEKLKKNEEVYHDFTINESLFISLHKTSTKSGDLNIDFWLYGEKYSVKTRTIIGKLEKFMKY